MTWRRCLEMAIPIVVLMPLFIWLFLADPFLPQLSTNTKLAYMLARLNHALPWIACALAAFLLMLPVNGTQSLRTLGLGVSVMMAMLIFVGLFVEGQRLYPYRHHYTISQLMGYADATIVVGNLLCLFVMLFGLKAFFVGELFTANKPRRLRRRKAVHGDSDFMAMHEAGRIFPPNAPIIIGERYRPPTQTAFNPNEASTWGEGGKAPLLGFDCDFGSTHGLIFAGSGGYKTTSIIIPTAMNWPHSMVVLDPSAEIAPIVKDARNHLHHKIVLLNPASPLTGFNVLDWIDKDSPTMEADCFALAGWIIAEKPDVQTGSDAFFGASSQQLISTLIADEILESKRPTLAGIREKISKTPNDLMKHLKAIVDKYETGNGHQGDFIRQLAAPLSAMDLRSFTGIHATASKDTNWLTIHSYAALVCGDSFKTDDFANGTIDIFVQLDMNALKNHPGIARVIFGTLLNAIYNRKGNIKGRALFLMDEAARLGYMNIIETARDAGRKYGITMLLAFQSIGQLRETFGGRDSASKWFESVSWVSFACINDPETADYISKRCGDTTVEGKSTTYSHKAGSMLQPGTRSHATSPTRRALIQPREVMEMRDDEQIIFTRGKPPLRCGRAIWFRRS